MDVQYKAGVDADCGEPLCCRDTNSPAKNGTLYKYKCVCPPHYQDTLCL